MKLFRAGAVCVALLLGVVVCVAGEEQGLDLTPEQAKSPRQMAMEQIESLDHPFLGKRLEAMDKIITVPSDLIREFKVIEKLTRKVTDEKVNTRERVKAIEALLQLVNQGVKDPELFESLLKIVEDPSGRVKVRLQILALFATMASKDDSAYADTAFDKLKDFWDRRKRLKMPSVLTRKIIEVIGAFTKKSEAKKILTEALKDERDPEMRASILVGIRNYLQELENREYDKKLVDGVSSLVINAKANNIKLRGIRVLEILANVIPERDRRALKGVKKVCTELLNKGGDLEVQTATSLLILMNDADVYEDILKSSLPSGERKLSLDTYIYLNMALIEVMNQLRSNAKKSENKALAEKISQHFMKLLDPKVRTGVPETLREQAAVGLGSWDVEFDRTEIVKFLVQLLDYELKASDPQAGVILKIEESLSYLTNINPAPRTPDPTTKKPIPDIATWKEEAKALIDGGKFEPGKDPSDE